ncbi:MAG: hypothetical protein WC262_11910 [Bacteroidales bacterium]|jgi:uncharacterized Zn-finger protein
MDTFDQKTGKVAFSLTQEFDTIRCPYCEQIFLLFAVMPYTGCYGESEADIWTQAAARYCPYCGKNIDKETDAEVRGHINEELH